MVQRYLEAPDAIPLEEPRELSTGKRSAVVRCDNVWYPVIREDCP